MQLRPMNDEEFIHYMQNVYRDYADEQVKVGAWPPAEALEMAKTELSELLPDGLATPDHHFYNLMVPDEPEPVGVLWIMVRERNQQKEAFIDDIIIHSRYRRKGYASQALNLLDEVIKEMGIHRLRLQVYGHNKQAIALYQKAGYEIINIYMEKRV